MALIIWFAARFLLGGNLLAYPLTIALVTLASRIGLLLQNHRPDLLLNAAIEIAFALALIAWVALPAERVEA